jgi:predicted DNA-binding transcriptional regulator AlpA
MEFELLKLIPPDAEGYVMAKDLAKWFMAAITTIHRWSREGVLPPARVIGRHRVRWVVDEVREHLSKGKAAVAIGDRKGVAS